MFQNFRNRLRKKELLVGTMITLTSPESAEILAGAGFDWFFIDGEHGTFDASELQAIIGRVDRLIPSLVRIPVAEEVYIKKALDVGAAGIVVPQVNSATTAEKVVSYCRFPPEGRRGVGLGRAYGYGSSFKEYIEGSNENISVVIQAEHEEAVNNINEIVLVKGIDAILIGPYDLSASLGRMGEITHPDVQEAIEQIADACHAAKIPLGIFGTDVAAVRPFIDKGFTLIIAGTDGLFLGNTGSEVVRLLKKS
jgi:2-keto-3-deoxy-L-rhamnonate aldolase RhmA